MQHFIKPLISVRVIAATGALCVLVALVLCCANIFSNEDSLERTLEVYESHIQKDQPYREPTSDEGNQFMDDFQQLFKDNSSTTPHLTSLGYQVRTGTDDVSQKKYLLIINTQNDNRAWGAYILELGRTPKYVISAPHPKADINTEKIALDVWRQTNDSMVMIAGAHRAAANNLADVAHQPNSLFNRVSTFLSSQGVMHIQLHGFDDATAPGADIVISPGVAPISPLARQLASQLNDKNFKVDTSWQQANVLLAKTNAQSQAAREQHAVFVHIEMSNSVRESRAQAVAHDLASQLNKYTVESK